MTTTPAPIEELSMEEMAEHAEAAASLLKAMASPKRLQILCTLAEGEELSVGALNDRIPLSQSALSQHLAVLRADGLVTTRRESQTIFYQVAPGPALDVIRVLHGHFCHPQGPRSQTH
ncbi:metalloregulator ArsR/SmtB family transcription factor [uncultured Abyssibacter sp.]|uniref:ArsR/SmtB family transcription factor n=1 Tax=uncultured Abyssibacter sp. TaxID=2320202 RepID=UPI0032B175FE